MVVILICQRNTALRVLLKRPHKPELSEVGGRTLTFGHTDMDCGFSAWLSCTQSYPSAPCGNGQSGLCSLENQCFVAHSASKVPLFCNKTPLITLPNHFKRLTDLRQKKKKKNLNSKSTYWPFLELSAA